MQASVATFCCSLWIFEILFCTKFSKRVNLAQYCLEAGHDCLFLLEVGQRTLWQCFALISVENTKLSSISKFDENLIFEFFHISVLCKHFLWVWGTFLSVKCPFWTSPCHSSSYDILNNIICTLQEDSVGMQASFATFCCSLWIFEILFCTKFPKRVNLAQYCLEAGHDCLFLLEVGHRTLWQCFALISVENTKLSSISKFDENLIFEFFHISVRCKHFLWVWGTFLSVKCPFWTSPCHSSSYDILNNIICTLQEDWVGMQASVATFCCSLWIFEILFCTKFSKRVNLAQYCLEAGHDCLFLLEVGHRTLWQCFALISVENTKLSSISKFDENLIFEFFHISVRFKHFLWVWGTFLSVKCPFWTSPCHSSSHDILNNIICTLQEDSVGMQASVATFCCSLWIFEILFCTKFSKRVNLAQYCLEAGHDCLFLLELGHRNLWQCFALISVENTKLSSIFKFDENLIFEFFTFWFASNTSYEFWGSFLSFKCPFWTSPCHSSSHGILNNIICTLQEDSVGMQASVATFCCSLWIFEIIFCTKFSKRVNLAQYCLEAGHDCLFLLEVGQRTLWQCFALISVENTKLSSIFKFDENLIFEFFHISVLCKHFLWVWGTFLSVKCPFWTSPCHSSSYDILNNIICTLQEDSVGMQASVATFCCSLWIFEILFCTKFCKRVNLAQYCLEAGHDCLFLLEVGHRAHWQCFALISVENTKLSSFFKFDENLIFEFFHISVRCKHFLWVLRKFSQVKCPFWTSPCHSSSHGIFNNIICTLQEDSVGMQASVATFCCSLWIFAILFCTKFSKRVNLAQYCLEAGHDCFFC